MHVLKASTCQINMDIGDFLLFPFSIFTESVTQ